MTISFMASLADASSLGGDLEEQMAELETRSQVETRQGDAPMLDDRTGAAVAGFCRDLRCTFCSPAMEFIAGPSGDRYQGRPITELLPFIGSVGDERFLEGVFAGQSGSAGPDWYLAAGGERLLLERHYAPLYDSSGQVVGGLVTVHNAAAQLFEDALYQLLRDTTSPDEVLFSSLVHRVATAFGARIGFLGELDERCPSRVRLRAVWDERQRLTVFQYDLRGTPCERAMADGLSYYPAGVQKAFPEHRMFREHEVESYLAVPLKDAGQACVGLLGVMHDRPIVLSRTAVPALQRLAAAAAREWSYRKTAVELASTSTRLRTLADKWIVDEERARQGIAADLHDRIGQNLLSAKIKLDQLLGSSDHPQPAELARECREIVQETIDDTRSLIFEICPPLLQESGLAAAVEWFSQQLQRQHDLAVSVTATDPLEPLAPEMAVMLFRSVRELLLNTLKHAKATRVTVEILQRTDRLEVRVEDDGIGFQPAAAGATSLGFGLSSIRERLRLIGGHLEVSSPPSGGAVGDVTSAPRRQRGTVDLPVKCLIADDHCIFRAGLESLLAGEADMVPVGQAKDGRTAVKLVKELAPDVVIMDVNMPELNGIEATRQIVASDSDAKILALSMHSDKRIVANMFRAGASGFLLKDCAFDELAGAIRTLAANQTYLGSNIAVVVLEDYVERLTATESTDPSRLSPREKEVLQLLVEGRTTKEIARRISVSIKTVDSHRKNIMDKLDLHSIAELTKYAIREGLTTVES